MSKRPVSEYIVNQGDTLELIAQRIYGDRRYAACIADFDPIARGDCLFVGHRLSLPPRVVPIGNQLAMSDLRTLKPARPLGHARVRFHFSGCEEVLRYFSPPHRGVGGWIGDMTISRIGTLNLTQLSPARIWGYYCEHLVWVGDFLGRYARGFPLPLDGVLKGPLQEWFIGTNRCEPASAVVDQQLIRSMSSLVLDEAQDERDRNHVPFARVLQAACPDLISPGFLAQLAPNARIRPKTIELNFGGNLAADQFTVRRASSDRKKVARRSAAKKKPAQPMSKGQSEKIKKALKQPKASKQHRKRNTVKK